MAAPPAASKAERAFVQDGIEQDMRVDGRRRDDFRAITVELGVLPQAFGSARVRLGGTEVLLGVRCEVEAAAAGEAAGARGGVGVSVEFADGGVGTQTDRLASEDAEAELAAALAAAFAGPSGGGSGGAALDWAALAVVPGRSSWSLSLEALVTADDGAVLDALSLAAKAALADTSLPQLEVSGGEEAEFELSDDVRRLDVSAVPLIVTVSRIGRRCVLDASSAEEAHCGAALWAAVTPRGDVAAAGARRGGALPPDVALDMLAAARAAAVALHKALDAHLAARAAAPAAAAAL